MIESVPETAMMIKFFYVFALRTTRASLSFVGNGSIQSSQDS